MKRALTTILAGLALQGVLPGENWPAWRVAQGNGAVNDRFLET